MGGALGPRAGPSGRRCAMEGQRPTSPKRGRSMQACTGIGPFRLDISMCTSFGLHSPEKQGPFHFKLVQACHAPTPTGTQRGLQRRLGRSSIAEQLAIRTQQRSSFGEHARPFAQLQTNDITRARTQQNTTQHMSATAHGNQLLRRLAKRTCVPIIYLSSAVSAASARPFAAAASEQLRSSAVPQPRRALTAADTRR